MKKFVVVFAILCLYACEGRNKIAMANKNIKLSTFDISANSGLGLLRPCLSDTTYVVFYESFDSPQPFDSLFFTSRYTDDGYKTRFETFYLPIKKFKPYELSEGTTMPHIVDFGPSVVFRVAAIEGRNYRVVINEHSGETAVIKIPESYTIYKGTDIFHDSEYDQLNPPNNNCYLFEKWEEYILRAELVLQPKLVLYDAPNGKVVYSKTDDENDFNPMHVHELKGDWARIDFRDHNDFANKWIRWRDGNNLLVSIIEATYD